MTNIESGTQLVADRYVLRSLIGRGGSGAVWSADDRDLRRRVAVKQIVVSEQRSTRSRARAMREARAVARLRSPGVVQVYDVHDDGEQIFLVMELIDAPSLSRLVRRSGPLDHERAAAIGQAMLSVLATVHAAGIVHRDVKPSNVLVDGTDVHLTDFGIALFGDDPTLTAAGSVLGTPAYMAPEQARGERAGPKADLYGLGATLYYAVEGRAPFADVGSWETTRAVREHPHRPGDRLGPLEPVVEALLAKDPDSRPGIADITAALAVVGTGATLTPPPWPAPTRGAPPPGQDDGTGPPPPDVDPDVDVDVDTDEAAAPVPEHAGDGGDGDRAQGGGTGAPRSAGGRAGGMWAAGGGTGVAPSTGRPTPQHSGDPAPGGPGADDPAGRAHWRPVVVTAALLLGLAAVLVLLFLAVRGGGDAPVTMLLLGAAPHDLRWRGHR